MGALLVLVLQATMLVRADTSARLFVGDPVAVSVRVELPRGATLVDVVPRTRDTVATGVRVLSADTLRRQGSDWVGRVTVAFFRPDSQAVPALAVAYRVGDAVDTVVSKAVPLTVQHLLPTTSQATLRDIRDIETAVVPWRTIGFGIIAIGLAVVLGRRRAKEAPAIVVAPPPAASAYEIALAELAAIERDGGDARRQAEAAADVVRAYLERARGVPALERTTPEVWRLLGDRVLTDLLADADRVKFARGQTDTGFVERARAVLRGLAA